MGSKWGFAGHRPAMVESQVLYRCGSEREGGLQRPAPVGERYFLHGQRGWDWVGLGKRERGFALAWPACNPSHILPEQRRQP